MSEAVNNRVRPAKDKHLGWGKSSFIQRSNGVKVHYEKNSNRVRVHHKKKSDGVRVHHKKKAIG